MQLSITIDYKILAFIINSITNEFKTYIIYDITTNIMVTTKKPRELTPIFFISMNLWQC